MGFGGWEGGLLFLGSWKLKWITASEITRCRRLFAIQAFVLTLTPQCFFHVFFSTQTMFRRDARASETDPDHRPLCLNSDPHRHPRGNFPSQKSYLTAPLKKKKKKVVLAP